MTLYRKLHYLIHQSRIWQAILYPLLAFILYLATSAQAYPVPSSANDKVNHVLAFFCLGILLRWSYPKLLGIWSLLSLVAYGLGLEVIQAFLPYREFSLLDLLADSAGAIIGLWIGAWALHGKASRW